MSIDSLLEDLGGCGIFQVLTVSSVYGSVIAVTWSMMFMAYGNYNPGWTCGGSAEVDSSLSFAYTLSLDFNQTSVSDPSDSCQGYSNCDNVIFDNDSSTIVTEWNLACDKTYLTSLMISLQMGGVLIGTFVAGQLNNYLGRKPTHFLTLFFHALLNVVIIFSVNWQMFTSLRFFMGITCGILLITTWLYSVEFVVRKWRSIVSAIPFWNTGRLVFAALAMLLKDWKLLHLATAILSAAMILPVFWVPESMRWLAVKGKTEKAYCVGRKIGRLNTTAAPDMSVIAQIAEEERKKEGGKVRINVLDLYKRGFAKQTIVTTLLWLCFTIVYYSIVYGVKALSGNFYINLMSTSCITTVIYPFTPLLSNILGRKYGCLLLMSLAATSCIILVCLHFMTVTIDKGIAVLILTLLVLTFIDGAWMIVQVYTIELYPTILRSLGLSHANSVARIGGIIAPFLIPRDESTAYITHIIMAIFILVTGTSLLLLEETKNMQMKDSMTQGIYKGSLKEMDAPTKSDELENLA